MANNDIKLSDMPKIADEIKDLLGLIILVTEGKAPQLKKDVTEIVDKIQGGINLQQLKLRTQTAVTKLSIMLILRLLKLLRKRLKLAMNKQREVLMNGRKKPRNPIIGL